MNNGHFGLVERSPDTSLALPSGILIGTQIFYFGNVFSGGASGGFNAVCSEPLLALIAYSDP